MKEKKKIRKKLGKVKIHPRINRPIQVNRYLITKNQWDSTNITPLSAVVTRITEPGNYLGVISANSLEISYFQLHVTEKAALTPVKINLNNPLESYTLNPTQSITFTSPKGSGGFKVEIISKEDRNKTPTFTTDSLQEEDIYIVTLLRPGQYSVKEQDGATGTIRVSRLTRPKQRIIPTHTTHVRFKPKPSVTIECSKKGFQPEMQEIVTTQGVVFTILKPNCRLKIQYEEDEDK
jgi:hypothetical protein